jgi:hypothetical protein
MVLLLMASASVASADPTTLAGDKDEGVIWFHLATQFGPGPGTPISISPDLSYWHGSMSYSLLHSSAAITGFTGLQSGSICVHDCDAWSSAYHGGAAQVGYRILHDDTLLELHAAAVLEEVDPAAFGIKLGGELWRYLGGDGFLASFKPNVLVPVTERDAFPGRFNLPISLGWLTVVELESGVTVPFDHAGDRWQVPISMKVRIPIGGKVLVDGALTFPAAFAGDGVETSGTDEITGTLGIELAPWLNRW